MTYLDQLYSAHESARTDPEAIRRSYSASSGIGASEVHWPRFSRHRWFYRPRQLGVECCCRLPLWLPPPVDGDTVDTDAHSPAAQCRPPWHRHGSMHLGGSYQVHASLVRPPYPGPVSYTHLRAHETRHDLVCRLLLE